MDVQDALELLGPQFTHSSVRRYAVARLKQAPDDVSLLQGLTMEMVYLDLKHMWNKQLLV